MSLIPYSFSSSDALTGASLSGFAPFTVVFQPSAISFGNQVVGRITYQISGVNYTLSASATRDFTYSTLGDALTGNTVDIDCRSNFVYTLYNTVSGRSITDIIVNAMLFPSTQTYSFVVRCYTDTPYITRNPISLSSNPYVFDSVHLLKNRSWGANNNQIIIAEGTNTTSQFIIFNTSDFTQTT